MYDQQVSWLEFLDQSSEHKNMIKHLDGEVYIELDYLQPWFGFKFQDVLKKS